ncbi:Serine/threonine-protein kinase smg1 [Mactra antiquata]
MNEASDGVSDKSNDCKNDVKGKTEAKGNENSTSNLNENASRPTKMVESASQKSTSAADSKSDKFKNDRFNGYKKYDSRDRYPYKGDNGMRPSPGGRGQRDDDRRSGPNKPFRKDSRDTRGSVSSYHKDNDVKKGDSGKPFVEESRLVKLARRIQRESISERRLSVAKQLVDYLRTSEGAKYAARNGEEVLPTLKDVFYDRGMKDVKNEVVYSIGLIGCLMAQDAHRYFNWLFGQINTVIEDDVRSLFLQALLETMKCEEKTQVLADFIPMVLNNLQSLLENADTPELLTSIVSVILQVTSVYPHIFQDYFRDTVDILVGWHIDSSQHDKVIDFTSKALISFQEFWVSDQSFTQELLGQFLEDMEAYAEDLNARMQDGHLKMSVETPDEVYKVGSLLKVFSTVVKSLGDDFDPNKSRLMHMAYFLEVFEKTVVAIDTSMSSYFSEFVVVTANECIFLLLNCLKQDVINCQETLLRYLSTVMFPTYKVRDRYCVVALQLMTKVIELLGTRLSVQWLTNVLRSDSLLHVCIKSGSGEVLKELTKVYQSLLNLRSVPLLEETYRHLLGDIQSGFNILLESCGDENLVNLTPNNPYDDIIYNKRDAEITCVFCLCVLGEIGNTKNNLIGMWALSPSLFDLYCTHLDVMRPSISVQYPALQYAILQSLYSHSTRHGNFISTSSLFTQNTPLEGALLANVNPTTSANFTRLLKLLADLFTHSYSSYVSKLLSLKWVSDIISTLKSSQHVYTTRQFLTLVQALYHVGYDQEEEVASAVQTCLSSLFKEPKAYPRYIVKGCMKLCIYRLSEGSTKLCEDYFSLLCLLPINVTASKNNGLYMLDEDVLIVYNDTTVGLPAMWQVCRSYTNRPPLGSFHSHNFRQVMGYLLHNTQVKQSGSLTWLESMYLSAQRVSSKPDSKSADGLIMQNYISKNLSVQWFWATWEAAQFCILTRLKTPLGKPQDTFTSIEAVLKSLALEADNGNSDTLTDGKRNKKSDNEDNATRVKLLLQFMEQLEKQLYNAYEGAAVSMPAIPKAVRTFFHTNKKTCQEWLARIRIFVLKIALHIGNYACVIRHASELLQELKDSDHTKGSQFETVLQYLCVALCHLGDTDAVNGLYAWCKDVIGRKFTWIKAAADKAAGRYEDAVDEYRSVMKTLIQSDKTEDDMVDVEDIRVGILGKLGGDTSRLPGDAISKVNIANEVLDCYVQLSDWDSAVKWYEEYSRLQADSVVNLPHLNRDVWFLRSMAAGDEIVSSTVEEQLDLIPGLTDLTKWGLTDRECRAQSNLLKATATIKEHSVNNHRTEIMDRLKNSMNGFKSLLKLQGMDWPVLASPDTLALLTSTSVLKSHIDEVSSGKIPLLPLSERMPLNESDHKIHTFLQAIRVVNHQSMISSNAELKDHLYKLQLATASLARKQQNYSLSEKLLLDLTSNMLNGENVVSLQAGLKDLYSVNGPKKQDILKIGRESAKLLHCISDQHEAMSVLCNSLIDFSSGENTKTDLCCELSSRSLLTLVKWFQVDHKFLSSLASKVGQGDGVSYVSQKIQQLLDIEEKSSSMSLTLANCSVPDLKIGDNPILTDTERIIGRLLHLSTIQCQNLPKAWYTFAGWCYKWGRKAVDNASHGSVQLFAEEKSQILSLLPTSIGQEEKESVMNILRQIHSGMTSEEDISDQDQSQYDDGTETTRRQLLATCSSIQSMEDNTVDRLLDVWQGVVHRIYHYYQLSANSYFKFLKLNGGNDALKEDNAEDCNVISTLRLLRLLVKHAWELRGVLEKGLAVTPTAPWKGIIPQLFSRLSHPEAYVRQSISDLLCRVAEDAPHLIVYPAVVGSTTTKLETKSETGLLNNYLTEGTECDSVDNNEDAVSQEEDDLPVELEADSLLHNCIVSMLNTLAANFPQMISDVKQLIEELRRITLLWDELWLGTLNQQHQDVERRISQLENEIKKVEKNHALSKEEKTAIIKEKHKTVLKPTVYSMERLHEITSQPAETPHEKWFKETYGQSITNALEKLKNPSNPSHPRASWHPFKQIHVSLQNKAQKRSSLVLTMDDISPKLHSLRNTVIAMPGLGTAGQIVTIESVSNIVQILPSKTKPKKLVFKGSDGKRYPYLFKGLEDLHLDERIMQFLNIVNNMFDSSNKGSHELHRARHYSVTPLGPRSGLIQWVDGVTPLFALYKRWQQREALIQLLKQQAASGSGATAQQPSIPRPSEVYYNKLNPLLRERGIKDAESRKDWPLSVQRKVLEELMSETPRDLLAKELWCNSTSPNEWWYVTQTYARSTAVMSIIGYTIGLGDRHLDNVMVDLATGEVVHIDYNVCFEKGKGLRVPEKVSFRLTQNIEAALGVTGIEGTFRLACEHVMKTLRKGRETLLTLLEAFVYDPLVDWTTGNESGYTGAFYGGGLVTGTSALESRQGKLDMEREITSSMFSIRVAEMKVAWLQNRDELLQVLPRIQGHLDDRTQRITDYSNCMMEGERLQGLKQVVKEAQGNTNSTIFTLHDRYKEYVVIKSARDSVNKLVEEKINDCLSWQKVHKHVMIKIQGSAFQKMCADIASSLNLGTPSFAAAKEFLQGAGQGSIIQQCEQVENELTSNLQIQRGNLHRVIDILHSYGTIVSQFGVSFANNTRTSNYLRWLKELSVDFTETKCAEIVQHFQAMYGESVSPQSKIQLVVATEMKLQNIIQDANARLIKLLERRSLEEAEIHLLELQVQESRVAIDTFIAENGESGICSLTAVIVSALCSLNKRNLQMEAAATGSGDRLMDLTSRDGDWFLEELCSMSGIVFQFLQMIKSCQQIGDGVQFSILYKGMMSTHYVYTALQDLNVNFRTIILPEALKIIQGQDPSVFSVLSQLENILSETGLPLDSIISQLEVLHRNAVMGIKTENNELLAIVNGIRQHFLLLLEGGNGSQELTPGQMLLMGFNGLFIRLDDKFSALLECVDMLQVPDIWKKVDVIREAKSLQLSSFTVDTRSLLSCLFFIRRLQVMQEFFHMCTQFAAAVQGLEGGNSYDDEQLSRPVKRFIADYVRKQIIGFPSQLLGYILCLVIHAMGLDVTAEVELKDIGAESKTPLEEIRKKAVDLCMRNGHFQQVHFSQASTMTSGYDAAWRRHDLTRRLDSNIDLLKGSLQRAQLHVTRLHWLHEDLFIQAGIQPNQLMVANRASIMSEIKKCMQALVSQETSLASCQTQYTQLEASITQRLKWAAGANPSLNLILQQFEDAGSVRKQLAEEESKHSQDIINLCQGILHLEALRTRTPEAMASDNNFLTLIEKCNESCMMVTSSSCSVTEAEAELMEIKPLEEGQRTDTAWLKLAQKEIKNQLQTTEKKVLALKNKIDEAKDGIKSEVNNIKTLLTTHHKLMSDIRAVLKSLAKQEEQDHGDNVCKSGVRDYLNLYKKFSENLTMALKMIVDDDFSDESLTETKSLIDALQVQIPLIYEDLISLAPPLISNKEESRNTSPLSFATAVKKPMSAEDVLERRPSVLHKEYVSSTPPTGSPQISGLVNKTLVTTPVRKSEKISRDPKTGKAIQERNSYAVGVWRRVKMKLDGRDPDQNKRLSVAEQVDFVIKDATNLDNLAVLYEGWTPWV